MSRTDETDPNALVNQTLHEIKRQRTASRSCNLPDYDDEQDTDLEYISQEPLPQQFFQELDNALIGLTREDYINEILRLCFNDYHRIDEYRNRLAERARTLPDGPHTRLVNRRNSPNASEERKYASDCYTIQAFLGDEKSHDINYVFVGTQGMDTTSIDMTPSTDAMESPDFLAMLTNINAELLKVSSQQTKNSVLIAAIHTELSQITANYRLLNGYVRSILARLPETNVSVEIDKIQTGMKRLGSSIAQ